MKKIIFLLLISIIAVYAQTATPSSVGDGSESNPYQIAILENLYWIAADTSNWDKHYIQTANIDATETENWFEGKGWLPIANGFLNYFTGSYDGQGFSINGLYINRPSEVGGIGLFRSIRNANIENLILSNVEIIGGHADVGAIAGSAYYASLKNCNTGGAVEVVEVYDYSTPSCAGGVVGMAYKSNIDSCSSSAKVGEGWGVGGIVGCNNYGSIANCLSSASVTGTNAGGIVGMNLYCSRVFRCFSNATVHGSGSGSGGIVGYNGTEVADYHYPYYNISECINTGKVRGDSKIGGIAGQVINTEIKNCYNFGSVSGQKAGGLAGNISFWGDINNCYNCGNISEGTSGLIGYQSSPISIHVNNSFWDIDSSYQTKSAGGIGISTEAMKNLSTYLDRSWNFTDIWAIDTNQVVNNGYPYLLWSEEIINLEAPLVPESNLLKQNYPNPFNSFTTLNYELLWLSDVQLNIYDILGRKIMQWSYPNQSAGAYDIIWNGKDQSSNQVPSGVYIYRMVAGEFVESRKMVLLK